jgi:hypothetical protein
MAEISTNLRQSNAKAFVMGVLSEKDLKVTTEDNKKKISGSLTIKTSDLNFVRFNVNVNEMTKANKPNGCFAGIQTVMNEYQSIAEVGEEEATKVKVNGDINLYRSQAGKDELGFKSNFFNRLKEGEEYEPKAEFSVETFVYSIVPEVDKEGVETGRIVVTGWIPTYNGIEPIKLVAEQDVGSAIESTFVAGQTVEFYGEIINNRVETITEIPVAIGKPRIKKDVTYKNDMLVTGASEAYEEGTTAELPYDAEVIKAAIQIREEKIAEDKAKGQNKTQSKTTQKPSGAAHGRSLGF